ncbi:chromatin accessibility complex protein 1-like isoform X1 [Lycorma delicatula]|uniref:chromatin accessibility complex protein 1-like isoform X1 n=1 Tax=Lycorma delicatula TaxID=130591 RepID=UPI003F5181ED
MATSEIPDVKTKDTQLPLSRTKIIMKSSPGVENVTKDSVYLTAKATELFVKYLAKEVIKNNSSRKKIEYKDVAEFVQSSRKLSFLHVLPDSSLLLSKHTFTGGPGIRIISLHCENVYLRRLHSERPKQDDKGLRQKEQQTG